MTRVVRGGCAFALLKDTVCKVSTLLHDCSARGSNLSSHSPATVLWVISVSAARTTEIKLGCVLESLDKY